MSPRRPQAADFGYSPPAESTIPSTVLSREDAWKLSRGCPECGGCGLVARAQHPPGFEHPITFALACRCPYGGWLYRSYQASTDRDLSRVAWLQHYPEAWTPGLDHRAFDPVPAQPDGPRIRGLSPLDTVVQGGARELPRKLAAPALRGIGRIPPPAGPSDVDWEEPFV